MTIDLHMHTYYSDGRPAPEELVNHAAGLGLKTIAITDHDTIRGSIEARDYARKAGIDLIPAVEITTQWDAMGSSVDVLAYFVDFEDAGLRAMLDNALTDLRDRITTVCAILTRQGYPITYAEVQGKNPRYAGAVHLIQVLEDKDMVNDFAAGLTLFLNAWDKVRHCGLEITGAIQTINDAGGVAVLAHPTRIRESWITEDEVAPLVSAGLGGIEVYHPSVSEEARPYFAAMGEALNLVVTGGSDEHGYPDGFPRLGKQPVTQAMVDGLRARAE